MFFDNFRVTLTEGPVAARSDYYPFGMLIEGLSHATASAGPNKYLYNGKELQDDQFGGVSLEMYDYGARMYDPQLGRWNAVDALADDAPGLTPYRYCFNNPVNYVDPFGLWEVTAGGYKTSDVRDINRFMSYTQLESIGGKSPSVSQINGFIYGEMNNPGGGRLSDGSRLLTGINMVGDDDGWSPTQSSIRRTLREMYGEYAENGSIGAPGTAESLIPVWGSGRAAINDFQNGNYGWAAFNAAMAVSDVFLVKSIATGIARGEITALSKNYTRWSSFRRFYGEAGFAEAGQHVHHWLWARNGPRGQGFAWWVKNQMWNLKPLPSHLLDQANGIGWNQIHNAVEGKVNRIVDYQFNMLQRLYYGTPSWPWTLGGSYGSRTFEGTIR